MSAEQHRAYSPSSLGFAFLTVSDTRTAADDTGGALNQATVELWRAGEPPVRLATGTSDGNGRVVLVMPNPTVNKSFSTLASP